MKVQTVSQIRSIFLGMDQGVSELRTSNIKGENPFQDPKVRMAMNLAIDKKAIRRVVMDDLSFPTGIITPPGVLGNTPELDKSYGFDVAKAKALMKEAGYGDGFSITLNCPNDRYINDERAQSILATLSNAPWWKYDLAPLTEEELAQTMVNWIRHRANEPPIPLIHPRSRGGK